MLPEGSGAMPLMARVRSAIRCVLKRAVPRQLIPERAASVTLRKQCRSATLSTSWCARERHALDARSASAQIQLTVYDNESAM